jgi:undecaprenyl-diphosphatase
MNKLILILLCLSVNAYSQNLDVIISKHVNRCPEQRSNGVLRFISNSEPYVIVAVPTGIIIDGLIRRDDEVIKNGGVIAVSTLVNLGLTTVIKHLVKRQRPYKAYPGILFNNTGRVLNDYSFPSGHSSGSFTTAASLSLIYHKWFITAPAFAWVGVVGYSRVQLGAHYASDVLSGAVLGSGTALIINNLK